MKLNATETAILATLVAAEDYGGFNYLCFEGIRQRCAENGIEIDRKLIRRVCRKLARNGLAEYGRGLWTQDGTTAGSGYAATKKAIEQFQGAE